MQRRKKGKERNKRAQSTSSAEFNLQIGRVTDRISRVLGIIYCTEQMRVQRQWLVDTEDEYSLNRI